LKGIESEIRAGSLDHPDDILARFDFVIAQCAQSVPTAARRANGAYRQSRREPIYNHTRPAAACSCDGIDTRSTWNVCSGRAGTPASP
jgi:hypothetical protein